MLRKPFYISSQKHEKLEGNFCLKVDKQKFAWQKATYAQEYVMTNRISEYDIEVYLNCIIHVTTFSKGNLLSFQTTCSI